MKRLGFLVGITVIFFLSRYQLAAARAAHRAVPLAPILGTYANASIPLSTDATVTPNSVPSNTTNISVSTSTNFKGRLEGYAATGVVRVTDAHPAGIYTVTVRAFDSSGVSATQTFTLTVTTPATCRTLAFDAALNFGAGTNPTTIAAGDFNGDGKQDLATVNSGSNNMSILLGNGAGNFTAGANLTTGSFPFAVAVGDFNRDGKQDLVVTNFSSNNVSIFLGNGTGGFAPAVNFGTGTGPISVAVGDFNGDGEEDIVTANDGGGVSIVLGNGAGSFGTATSFAAGTEPSSVAVGDFNGDGKQDLAVANFGATTVSILLGNGAGSFGAATNFAAASSVGTISLVVGDFNGDGKQDLAVADFNPPFTVSILLGNGAGSFGAPTDFGAGNRPEWVAAGDFNGDGKQDLVIANNDGSGNVLILSGNGDGTFIAERYLRGDNVPFAVAVGDFNGDGMQDLAVANNASNNVSILLRDCPVPLTFLISSITRGANGHVVLNGISYPNDQVTIFASPDLSPNSFVVIGSAATNPSGVFQYDDAGAVGLTKRFYRATYP